MSESVHRPLCSARHTSGVDAMCNINGKWITWPSMVGMSSCSNTCLQAQNEGLEGVCAGHHASFNSRCEYHFSLHNVYHMFAQRVQPNGRTEILKPWISAGQAVFPEICLPQALFIAASPPPRITPNMLGSNFVDDWLGKPQYGIERVESGFRFRRCR